MEETTGRGNTEPASWKAEGQKKEAISVSLFPSTAPFPIRPARLGAALPQRQGIVTGSGRTGRYIPQSQRRVESRRAVRQFVCLKSRVNGVAKSGVGGWVWVTGDGGTGGEGGEWRQRTYGTQRIKPVKV